MIADPFPSPDQIAAANAQLVEVVRRRLPVRVYGGERWWTLFRSASLARMADTVESLMDLMAMRRDLDGQTLVRSLYEQVVTFAWVAIDPDRRQWLWRNEGRWDLLKLHNDAMRFGEWIDEPVMTDEEVAEAKDALGLSRDVEPDDGDSCSASRGPRRRTRPDPELVLPPVTERAEAADQHWSVRVKGLHPADHPLGFRGLYLPVYRVGSRSAHGSLMALEAYMSREPNRIVIDRVQPGSRLTWALVGPLFGIALVIASRWEQWIDEAEVRDLVDLATGPDLEDQAR
jgi:uncharacterized protein DUF5677